MATFGYTLISSYPAGYTPLPKSRTFTYEDGIFFFFSTDFNLDILDSIDANFQWGGGSGGQTSAAWCWSSVNGVELNDTNSTVSSRTNDMTALKNQWTAERPYLVCRIGTTPTYGNPTINYNGYTITATGRQPHPTISIGDLITKANMDILREYKDNVPDAVTQYTKIKASDVTAYATATQNTKIQASWYNNA